MTRTNVTGITQDVAQALQDVACPLVTAERREQAHTCLATFAAVALRVMAKSEPWVVRDCAMTTEIVYRMPEVEA